MTSNSSILINKIQGIVRNRMLVFLALYNEVQTQKKLAFYSLNFIDKDTAIRYHFHYFFYDCSNNMNLYSTPQTIVRDVLRSDGILGFYRGIQSTVLREVPGYFVFFGGYEGTRYLLANPGQKVDDIGEFFRRKFRRTNLRRTKFFGGQNFSADKDLGTNSKFRLSCPPNSLYKFYLLRSFSCLKT